MSLKSTILVVDDELTSHRVMERLLATQGYDLAFASDGVEALAKAAELTPDLILLDILMPVMDGFEVCRRLRADPILAEVPIVMLTALDDRDSRLQGLEAGADDFISKPFDTIELRAKVRTITRLNRYRRLLMERSHRQQSEEALQQSEERYRSITENILDGLTVIEHGKVVYVNDRACEIFGYPQDELVRLTDLDIAAPEERDRLQRIQEEAEQTGVGPKELEFWITRQDGIRRCIRNRYVVMRQGDEVIGRLVVTTDITERKRAEEALHRSLEETARGQRVLLALSQASQAVQRARTPAEVYRTVGDEVRKLGYHALVFSLTDDRAHLVITYLTFPPTLLRAVEKLTGLSRQTFRVSLAQTPVFQRVFSTGETSFNEPSTDFLAGGLPEPIRPLAGRITSMLGLEQSITARLTVGGQAHGLLVATGAGLTEADVPAVTVFANQASIAVENALMYEAEHAAREQLRDLTDYLQAAREEERSRIAHEIHDEFGQALTALKMDLSWLTQRLPADEPGLAEKASAMSGLIDDTIQKVRHVATRLRPGLLDDLGLAAAIEWQTQEFAARTEMDCELTMSGEEIDLDPDLATAVFRILQETLTNVARHAQATEVRVELQVRPDELALVIRDNGKGITESQVSDPRSLGLIGMRERAHSWGGDVAFEGVPGQGTTVTVRIPNAECRMRSAESFR